MDSKLQEFARLWTNCFPDKRVPDLSFLVKTSLNIDTIADALKNDAGETQTDLKETLTIQLKEVQYCLSCILRLHEERGNVTNVDTQSTYDGFYVSPKRPTRLSLDSRVSEEGHYINWKGPVSASKYDTLPTPRPKVIHSEKFTDTMTKVCEVIPPDQGRALVESLGVTTDSGSFDLPRMLLENEMINELDLTPFFKALKDNQLAHLISFFDKFQKRETLRMEENAKKTDDYYMDMKPALHTTSSPPSSARRDMFPQKFFPGEPADGEDLYCLSNKVNDVPAARGGRSVFRRGSLPGDTTNLGGSRGQRPHRDRHVPSKSVDSILPKKLLSVIKPKSKPTSLPQGVTTPQRNFIGEEGSNRRSPVQSPVSPMGPRDGSQFVVRIIDDWTPSGGTADASTSLEGYERLPLSRGECLDVICLWSDEFVARNLKGEIGLVSKDKCEVLTGVSPVLWRKEWFLKCSGRHTALDLLQNEPVGTFFIRESHSKSGDFVLSVKLLTITAKFQIMVKMAKYEVSSLSFSSLDAIISHYKENIIYLEDGKGVFLTKPLKHERCT